MKIRLNINNREYITITLNENEVNSLKKQINENKNDLKVTIEEATITRVMVKEETR